MRIIKDNACVIDMISKEAIIKNHAKLKKAHVKTIPYAIDMICDGERRGHACMLFHYKGDTWHYDNSFGSVRVYQKKYVKDVFKVAQRVYSTHKNIKVLRAFPMEFVTHFPDQEKELPKKYIKW